MSPLTPPQLALVSAALRHVQDAERLLTSPTPSPDQAWHLAGFGPECVRKACLQETVLHLPLGHDLGEAGDALLEWWIPLDPAAWRYGLTGWAEAELEQWRPEHRYERTGRRTVAAAGALTRRSRERVDGVVAALWMDGRLRDGAL